MISSNASPLDEPPRRSAYAKRPDDEQFFQSMNQCLRAFQPPAATNQCDDQLIVYVVGVPRSGTTLLSQLIAQCLRVGYINNLTARFWMQPAVGIRLSRACLPEQDWRPRSLTSTHGVTMGAAGPHEFGYFWRHWLQLDARSTHHLTAEDLAAVDADGLRTALRAILAEFNSTVMFKNVICGFHASFLTALHQPSLFVRVRRDDQSVVRSILNARQERFGTHQAWWSLKPSTFPFPDLGADPVHDVVRQIRDCDAEFTSELGVPGVQSLEIEYDALCENPAEQLDRIRHAAARIGYPVELAAPPPARLERSGGRALDPHMSARIDHLLSDSADSLTGSDGRSERQRAPRVA